MLSTAHHLPTMHSDLSSSKKNKWWLTPAAILVVVAPLLAVALAAWDNRIVSWVSQRHLPGDIEKALQLSEAFAHGSGVLAIFAVLFVVDTSQRRKIVCMILMVVTAMTVANSCKLLISRSRPNAFEEVTAVTKTWLNKSEKQGYDTTVRSFPSGHSATAVAMAFALTNLYPRGKYLFVVLAVLGCLQRIASRAHFPTDVLGGVCVAATIALIWQSVFPQYFAARGSGQETIEAVQDS